MIKVIDPLKAVIFLEKKLVSYRSICIVKGNGDILLSLVVNPIKPKG